eukprot:9338820-Karenia_brevis.AAC.1
MPVQGVPVTHDHFEYEPSATSPLKGESSEFHTQSSDPPHVDTDARGEGMSPSEPGGVQLVQAEERWLRGCNGKFIAISDAPVMEKAGVQNLRDLRSSESSVESQEVLGES